MLATLNAPKQRLKIQNSNSIKCFSSHTWTLNGWKCCTPSVVFQAKWFMCSSIQCVMRPIHSAFCLLIVKMHAAVLDGCLIDVSLVKAVAPGFFCTVLDPELLLLFAFKKSHKRFMCSPKCDYFSWAAGFIWHRNLFFCIRSKREKLWM